MTNAKKAVVLLSGGMDSTTLLARTLADGLDIHALSILYGQRHVKEIDAALNIGAHYNVEHEVISVPNEILASGTSSQTGRTPVPHGHYTENNMKATVVPNRNMFFLSIAVARAIALGAAEVRYAAHAGDHAIYPDCRPRFVAAMQKAVELCDWHPPTLVAPFLSISKAMIVEIGARINVPWQKTWTCYEGKTLACGRCGTCVERLEAFALAGVEDPLEYEDRTFWQGVTSRT
jgi:7-cyano-7-deazaguanine synthase